MPGFRTLQNELTVGVDAEDVLGLQVAMCDAFLVEKVDARCDLPHNLRRIMFREADVLLDTRQQGPSVDLLEDQIKLLLVFEELNQLKDVGVALTVVKGLHFSEHSRPSMARDLLDNFYGTFCIEKDHEAFHYISTKETHTCIGEDVNARLY